MRHWTRVKRSKRARLACRWRIWFGLHCSIWTASRTSWRPRLQPCRTRAEGKSMDFDESEEDLDEENEGRAGGDDDEEEDEPPAEERYFIDADWYEGQGLSFNDVVQERMCPQCQKRVGEDVEERYPVLDKK